MSATVTVSGNQLGKILEQRGEDTPHTLHLSLDSAERITTTVPKTDGTPPKIIDEGPGPANLTLTTERTFENDSEAQRWLLQIARTSGYVGRCVIELPDGSTEQFDHVTATPSNGHPIGVTARVTWTLVTGSET